MKKILILLFISSLFLMNGADATTDASTDINSLKKEIDGLKKDIEQLKLTTSLINFDIEGSIKVTWGFNFASSPINIVRGGNSEYTHGFDFENNLRIGLALNNNIFSKRLSDPDFADLSIKLKMKTLRAIPYDTKPADGDYYKVQAIDNDGNQKTIYFPQNDDDNQPLTVGNFQFILEEVRLSNIIGSGVFVNYANVTSIHSYYGLESLADVMLLNDEYLNHDFYNTNALFFTLDSDSDFDYKTKSSDYVNSWVDRELSPDQTVNGISLGFDKDLSDNFNAFVELGVASKDAFDSEKFEDGNIDYGFFLRGGPAIFADNYSVRPRASLGVAFQTETTKDLDYGWSTFSFGFILPVKVILPSGKLDYFNLDIATNFKKQFSLDRNAFFFSFKPEFNILNDKLHIAMPIVYSYMNEGGGFFDITDDFGNEYTQIYDEHIFSMGLLTDVKLPGLTNFKYILSNKLYFTTVYDSEYEYYFHEILRNTFNFENLAFLGSVVELKKFEIFTTIGYTLARNARLQKIINADDETYTIPDTQRMHLANVMYFDFGFNLHFTDFMMAGVSINSPKLFIGSDRTDIGNQETYTTIKIYTEIKL